MYLVFPAELCGRYSRTKPLVNAPLQNPTADDLTEIEVTDPMHPLFGRRFAVISLSTSRQGSGHAVVAYKGYMRINSVAMRIKQKDLCISPVAMRIGQDSMRTDPGDMRIRIPLSVTQLALPQRALGSKLTLESMTELVTLAEQYEILCPSLPTPSGTVLTPDCKQSSSKNSKPSARK